MTLTYPCLDADIVAIACLITFIAGLAVGQAYNFWSRKL